MFYTIPGVFRLIALPVEQDDRLKDMCGIIAFGICMSIKVVHKILLSSVSDSLRVVYMSMNLPAVSAKSCDYN